MSPVVMMTFDDVMQVGKGRIVTLFGDWLRVHRNARCAVLKVEG